MLFEVTRTSIWNNEKPYDKCTPIQLVMVDSQDLRSPEEFDAKFSERAGKWLDVGFNHRIDEQGYIVRDIGVREAWGIEINTLEDLLKFKNEVNEDIILRESYIDEKTPCLEIYDTYGEF